MRVRGAIASEALMLLLASVLLLRVAPYLRIHDVQAGDRAPHFDLTEQGGPALDHYEGKFLLLNFWATWCKPCVEEMPSLNRLQQEMAPKGLVVLGVSIDENADYYGQFIRSWEIKFPTVREPSRDTMIRYGTEKGFRRRI